MDEIRLLNKRYELDADFSGRMQLYYWAADRRLHLFGAEQGTLTADYNCDGAADMVGLGRIIFADPLWPRKASGEILEPINPCAPTCSLCTKRIVEQKPAFCARWPEERRERFLERVGG